MKQKIAIIFLSFLFLTKLSAEPKIQAPTAILMDYNSGKILLNGFDPNSTQKNMILSKVGMLFQGSALFDSLPIWQNVAFRYLHGKQKINASEARKIAIEKLERVGLKKSFADNFPSELSGGMQKRVALARAIATQPEIIFFDEPTTGLDPIMAQVINDLIRELVEELGVTAVTITHDIQSVRSIADEVALLHDGIIPVSYTHLTLPTNREV